MRFAREMNLGMAMAMAIKRLIRIRNLIQPQNGTMKGIGLADASCHFFATYAALSRRNFASFGIKAPCRPLSTRLGDVV
jgi:hypothetical protein